MMNDSIPSVLPTPAGERSTKYSQQTALYLSVRLYCSLKTDV